MATDIFITHAVTVCTCYALLSLKTHLYGLNWMRCGGAGTASGCQRPGAICQFAQRGPGGFVEPVHCTYLASGFRIEMHVRGRRRCT